MRYLEHLYLLPYKVGHWFREDAIKILLGQTLEGHSDRQTTLTSLTTYAHEKLTRCKTLNLTYQNTLTAKKEYDLISLVR